MCWSSRDAVGNDLREVGHAIDTWCKIVVLIVEHRVEALDGGIVVVVAMVGLDFADPLLEVVHLGSQHHVVCVIWGSVGSL